jgi:flagellar hook assembly protein FlgD
MRWGFGVGIQITDAPVAVGPFDPHLRHWPNPSSSTTTILFDLPRQLPVQLAIYDTRGRRIRTLLSDAALSGPCESVWDGRDEEGQYVGAGVYFYQLKAQHFTRTRKLTLLK